MKIERTPDGWWTVAAGGETHRRMYLHDAEALAHRLMRVLHSESPASPNKSTGACGTGRSGDLYRVSA